MSRAGREHSRPIVWLLAAAMLAALLVFTDFGLTWDEPLFYDYADAVGYAYSPANWLRPDFDLSNSYGPSGDDHKTRGPGYLVIARIPVAVLQTLGAERSSAWHLVNFATFLFGVYCVFKLSNRLASEPAAVVGSALFASQPLLWGHAFINPKDMPFLVLFTAAVCFGTNAADQLCADPNAKAATALKKLIVPALFVGLASSNRVLGPLSGLLVGLYWLVRRPRWSTVWWLAMYGLVAAAFMFATWPYLWEDPRRFGAVFGFMAENPTTLQVLFADGIYRANELPLRYLPFYLVTTLTEPTWLLFLLGVGGVAIAARMSRSIPPLAAVLFGWLVIPMAYVLIARPPMYDGMRHFLFILPPAFIFGAVGLDLLRRRLPARWMQGVLAAMLLLPGLGGILALHPYEYSYFNALVGGTGGAFRHYETEYWLTCYKEAVQELNSAASKSVRLFVHREAAVAAPYAANRIEVLNERGAAAEISSGDFVLVNTRTNEDLHVFRGAPEIIVVGRAGATFCIIKEVP